MSFHTRINPGAKYSICELLPPCRSSSSISTPLEKNSSVQTELEEIADKCFSQVSRRDVMITNLMKGKSFIQMQSENLSEIMNIFTLLRSAPGSVSTNTQDEMIARNVLYLETMGRISRSKHLHFPLFGYGYEPPIRVHLSLGGNPEVFNFETLPLLGGTAFDSLIHSGACSVKQGDKFLNQISKELLDLMLKAEGNLIKTSEKIIQLNTFYSGRDRIHKKTSPPPPNQNQHFSKRIFRKLNFLK